jgi:hypothetical protein
MVRSLLFVVVLFLSINYRATPSAADSRDCSPLNTDIPVGSALASAGFFANLRHASNSISFLMDQLITESGDKAKQLTASEGGCARSCDNAIAAVVFTSTPHMTLPDYDDAAMCAKLYQTTRQTPIEYRNRAFDTQEEAEEWYNDLTQGDGSDGEDLYKRCPGACSPSYSSVAYEVSGKFTVSTSIICGHARDKDDNQYRLTASVRWVCPVNS